MRAPPNADGLLEKMSCVIVRRRKSRFESWAQSSFRTRLTSTINSLWDKTAPVAVSSRGVSPFSNISGAVMPCRMSVPRVGLNEPRTENDRDSKCRGARRGAVSLTTLSTGRLPVRRDPAPHRPYGRYITLTDNSEVRPTPSSRSFSALPGASYPVASERSRGLLHSSTPSNVLAFSPVDAVTVAPPEIIARG